MGRRRWEISASRRLPTGGATSALAVGGHARSRRAPLLRRSTAGSIIISNARRGFARTRARFDKIESHLYRHAGAETPRCVTRRGPRLRGHPRFSCCPLPTLPRTRGRVGRGQTWMAGAGSAITPTERFNVAGTRCSSITSTVVIRLWRRIGSTIFGVRESDRAPSVASSVIAPNS